MIELMKFAIFILITSAFGFISLSQIIKIKSLLFLLPCSVSFGLSTYIATCHVFAFLFGAKSASVLALFLLLLTSIIILITKRKSFSKIELEINQTQLITITLTSLAICILSFLAIFRFGIFDKEFHDFSALTIYHNNIYPPRDYFKPQYIFLYHYGGDLLAGAIHHISNINIELSFELISSIFSGITFFSFFLLAWSLSKNFKISLISAFCTYFGGGLLWLDAICRHLFKNFPGVMGSSNFFQTFFSFGVHGGITNAPSVSIFVPTFCLGYPLLILSLLLFLKLLEEKNFKTQIFYIIFLNISLFSLSLSAEWLYITFWAGVLAFLFFSIITKQKIATLHMFILFASSILFTKLIGSTLFLHEPLQHLGRANIFNVAIKENIFTVTSWGRLSKNLLDYMPISCFSWDFISEFGFSLILFPTIIIYLIKSKDKFAYLLFFIAITTMPIPLFIDFKTNPADLNRFFAFGNAMLIILITCSISFLFKSFFNKKALIITYLIAFGLSPLSGLISSVFFTPYFNFSKYFTELILTRIKNCQSTSELNLFLKKTNEELNDLKNGYLTNYKQEIDFLELNSTPKDAAISTLPVLPLYAGIYTIIPSKVMIYRDQLHSTFDNIYSTIFGTLDPYLLNELNVKWVIVSRDFKNKLPKEIQDVLRDENLFKLAYLSTDKNETPNLQLEIYQVNNTENILNNYTRKTAWFLADKTGKPIELTYGKNKISLFPSSIDTLLYLKQIQDETPALRKELITAQPVEIKTLEKHILDNKLNIILEKRF